MIAALVVAGALAGATTNGRAQSAPADTVVFAPDTTATAEPPVSEAVPDSIHAVTVTDSLGIPGTLKGQTDYDPVKMKEILKRMGSSEVEGRTTWERKKNPRTAMLCSALLPGLGQTYNGRRLKVGVMVGVASYYMGNMVLNWHSTRRTTSSTSSRFRGRRSFALPASWRSSTRKRRAHFSGGRGRCG
jgi:hypothetical protein